MPYHYYRRPGKKRKGFAARCQVLNERPARHALQIDADYLDGAAGQRQAADHLREIALHAANARLGAGHSLTNLHGDARGRRHGQHAADTDLTIEIAGWAEQPAEAAVGHAEAARDRADLHDHRGDSGQPGAGEIDQPGFGDDGQIDHGAAHHVYTADLHQVATAPVLVAGTCRRDQQSSSNKSVPFEHIVPERRAIVTHFFYPHPF